MQVKKFGVLVKALQSAYPNFKIIETEESFKMWYSMLKDLGEQDLAGAVYNHIKNEKYPPAIADLRASAEEVYMTRAALEKTRKRLQLNAKGIEEVKIIQETKKLE